MYAKKKYQKGGRLEEMLAKYMKGGMMKYENGGPIKRSSSVNFGDDAVGEVLGGRASAANPNDMDFIRDVMVRAFNESKFGGENRGKPYRILTDDSNFENPYFYEKDNQDAFMDVINKMHSQHESSGTQGSLMGPYRVMVSALDKLDGMNENQKSKATQLAYDMANALYPTGF